MNRRMANTIQTILVFRSLIFIYSQPKQLQHLINSGKELDSNLRSVLVKAKDILLVGCTVALRYSDLMNLRKTNLQVNNQQYYLKVQSKKTKAYTQIKLPLYAVEIFRKYSKKGNRLLPYFNLVRLNLYLKELAEHLGWTDEVVKTRQKRGKAIVVYKDASKGRITGFVISSIRILCGVLLSLQC